MFHGPRVEADIKVKNKKGNKNVTKELIVE